MTTLNFTLSPQATQKVHEALLCLSKFSEFVSLEARRNQLCLSALNSTKSAYGAVHLGANRFCEEFNFVPAEGEERFQCRLQVKVCLSSPQFPNLPIAGTDARGIGSPLRVPPTLPRQQRQIGVHLPMRSATLHNRTRMPPSNPAPLQPRRTQDLQAHI